MVDFQTYRFKCKLIWLIVAIFFSSFFCSKDSFCSNKDCISVLYEPTICVEREVRFALKTLGTCTITDIKWNFGADASVKTADGAEPALVFFTKAGKKDITVQYYDHEKDEPVKSVIPIEVEVINPVAGITILQSEPCVGQTIELSADGPIAGYYVWKGGNLRDGGVSGELEYKITDNLTVPNQTYTLEWYVGEAGGDAGCRYQKITKTVEDKSLPPIEFIQGSTIKVCQGESVSIDIKNPEAMQYDWNCEENSLIRRGHSIQFTPIQSCQIKVTALDNGCLRSGTINIILQEIPKIQIYPENSMICSGSSVQLHVLGAIDGETYLWSENVRPINTYANAVIVEPEISQTYEVTWVSGNCKTTATANVQVSDITNILENKTINICEGEEVSLQVTRPNDGTIQWFGGDLPYPVDGEEIMVSPQYNTTYMVAWNNQVCRDTGMIKVQVNLMPTIKLTSSEKDDVCKGKEVIITAELSDASLENNFQWLQTNQQINTRSNEPNELRFVAEQSHTIEAIWVDKEKYCYHNVSASFELDVIERPTQITLKSKKSNICKGDTIELEISGAQDESKYFLINKNTGETIPSSKFIGNGFQLVPDSTTIYVAFWVNDCETISNELQIEVNPIPSVEINQDEVICPGENFMVKVLPDSYGEYKWTGGNIEYNSLVTGSTFSRIADDNRLTYNLKVTENGCKLDTIVKINLIDIAADISTDDPHNEVCEGDAIQLKVSGGDDYIWEPSRLLDDHLNSTPVATITEPTQFRVTAYKDGCKFINTIDIKIKSDNDCEIRLEDLEIPNAITPNGDGKNDYWEIPFIDGNTNYRVTIFNETGSIMYGEKTYENDFEGYNKGQIPEGTYYYIIVQKDGLDKRTGTLTIIR